MPPSRFCREFKAAFGVTFVEHLANARVLQAKRLLANPTMPVADVAAAVGFTDPSYFTRVFRKQEGVSPTEYRARQPSRRPLRIWLPQRSTRAADSHQRSDQVSPSEARAGYSATREAVTLVIIVRMLHAERR